jgi:hypothetical protein
MTEIKKKSSLKMGNFRGAEYHRNVWCAVVESGTTSADLLRAEFWAHIAHQVKSGDRIEVENEDDSFYAELYVRSVGTASVKVSLLNFQEFDAAGEEPSYQEQYSVEFKGKISKWCVIRLKDKTMVHQGANNKQEATAWLTDHMKALAA